MHYLIVFSHNSSVEPSFLQRLSSLHHLVAIMKKQHLISSSFFSFSPHAVLEPAFLLFSSPLNTERHCSSHPALLNSCGERESEREEEKGWGRNLEMENERQLRETEKKGERRREKEGERQEKKRETGREKDR